MLSESKKILGFQVTITQPFTKHPKLDKESVKNNCDGWKEYCGVMEFSSYWMIPEICVGTEIRGRHLCNFIRMLAQHISSVEEIKTLRK